MGGGVRDLEPGAVPRHGVTGVGDLDAGGGAAGRRDQEPVAEHAAARVPQRPPGLGERAGAVEALERVVAERVRDLEPATGARPRR